MRSACPKPIAFQTGRSDQQCICHLTELAGVSLGEGAFSLSFRNAVVWLTAQILSLRYIGCHCYPVSDPLLLSGIIKKPAKGQLVNHWIQVLNVSWYSVDSGHCTSMSLGRLWNTNDKLSHLQMSIKFCCSPSQTAIPSCLPWRQFTKSFFP